MSEAELFRILNDAMRAKYGFRTGDIVRAIDKYRRPDGLRVVLGEAHGPSSGLFWVKYFVGGKPVGRRYAEFCTRLIPFDSVLDQLALIG